MLESESVCSRVVSSAYKCLFATTTQLDYKCPTPTHPLTISDRTTWPKGIHTSITNINNIIIIIISASRKRARNQHLHTLYSFSHQANNDTRAKRCNIYDTTTPQQRARVWLGHPPSIVCQMDKTKQKRKWILFESDDVSGDNDNKTVCEPMHS